MLKRSKLNQTVVQNKTEGLDRVQILYSETWCTIGNKQAGKTKFILVLGLGSRPVIKLPKPNKILQNCLFY